MVQENYPLSNRLKLEGDSVLLLRGTDYQKRARSSPRGIYHDCRAPFSFRWLFIINVNRLIG